MSQSVIWWRVCSEMYLLLVFMSETCSVVFFCFPQCSEAQKLLNIAKELLHTEEAYVKRLNLLDQVTPHLCLSRGFRECRSVFVCLWYKFQSRNCAGGLSHRDQRWAGLALWSAGGERPCCLDYSRRCVRACSLCFYTVCAAERQFRQPKHDRVLYLSKVSRGSLT